MVAQGLMRLGHSDWLVGGRYLYLDAKARFVGDAPSQLSTRELESRIDRASLPIDYDSRDNMFTPSAGSFAAIDIGVARPELGGSSSFDSVMARGHTHLPLGRATVLGLRADGKFSDGEVPF